MSDYDAADVTWEPATHNGIVTAIVTYPTPHRWWSWRRWIGKDRGPTAHVALVPDADGPPSHANLTVTFGADAARIDIRRAFCPLCAELECDDDCPLAPHR